MTNSTKQKPIVALIGPGRWGRRILAKLRELSYIKHVGYTGNPKTLEYLANAPELDRLTTNLKEIFSDQEVTHIFITTPPDTHYELTKSALLAGKNVMVEKPLSVNPAEVDELYELAKQKQVFLLTGYVYLYSEALQELRNRLLLEPPETINLIWEKWGTFDTNIIINLLVHELAIAQYLTGSLESICTFKQTDNTIQLKSKHGDSVVSININRASKTKRKEITCNTEKQTYVLEDEILKTASETIFVSEEADILKKECSYFLAGKKQFESQNIDMSVAEAVKRLDLKTLS